MQAQCKATPKQHRTVPIVERRPPNFEYLFMLPAMPSPASRILVTCWTRLAGFVPHVMRHRVPCRIAPAYRVLVLLCALLSAPAVSAQPFGDPSSAEPVRREILAIYDSREEPRPDQTRIHRFAEMPLNHLGFVVTLSGTSAPACRARSGPPLSAASSPGSGGRRRRRSIAGGRSRSGAAFAWSSSATAGCRPRPRRSPMPTACSPRSASA